MNYFLNLDAAATEYGSSTLDAIWGSDDFAGLYVTTDDGATWTELYLWDGTNNPGAQGTMTVSYTHLTLPTSDLV